MTLFFVLLIMESSESYTEFVSNQAVIMPKIENLKSQIQNQKSKIQKDSGVILAAVLIMLGITVALILQAQTLACLGLKLEQNKLSRTKLRKAAADGAWYALNVLATDPDLLIDHTNEAWCAPMRLVLTNGIVTEIRIIDENRFLDANMLAFVSASQLQRPSSLIIRDLFEMERMPLPEQQVQVIQDWVDEDKTGRFEQEYYRRLNLSAEVVNAPLESSGELRWLLDPVAQGCSNTTSLAVLPGKTPHTEPVNVNTADRETLLAIFGKNNVDIVERIVRIRDAAPISSLDNMVDSATREQVGPYLTVHSSFFSVYSKAMLGDSSDMTYCLAQRDQGGNLTVLRWVEH